MHRCAIGIGLSYSLYIPIWYYDLMSHDEHVAKDGTSRMYCPGRWFSVPLDWTTFWSLAVGGNLGKKGEGKSSPLVLSGHRP